MKNDLNPTQRVPKELTSLLEKAAEFHGHIGPFLTIGVRIGLIGLKKLSNGCNDKLTVEASLPLHVPFSCIIDGLQFTTHCTIGNQKLSVKDSDNIQVRFKKENEKKEVKITLNKSILEEMKSQLLGESLPDKEIRRLAWKIASLSEGKLFEIS